MDDLKQYENDFFDSLIKGNRFQYQKVMKEFRKQNLSIVLLYEEIFKKSLYRIGLILICLSLSVYSNILVLLREIAELREVTNISIIIGGQALKRVGSKLC